LVVDDVQFNIVVLTNYFNSIGIEVAGTAKNGPEALERYKEGIDKGEP